MAKRTTRPQLYAEPLLLGIESKPESTHCSDGRRHWVDTYFRNMRSIRIDPEQRQMATAFCVSMATACTLVSDKDNTYCIGDNQKGYWIMLDDVRSNQSDLYSRE